MNERIKELAEQAGLYDEQTPEEVPGFTACFEKLAELIVQECLNVLYANGLCEYDISEVLCDHFGVKE